MGLGIREMLSRASDLANKIHSINMKGPGIPKWLATRRQSMELNLTHVNDKLKVIGKHHPFCIIRFELDERKVSVVYLTHDDFEIEALFKRDYPGYNPYEIEKHYTSDPIVRRK